MFKNCLQTFQKLCLIGYQLMFIKFVFLLAVFNWLSFKLFINHQTTKVFNTFNQLIDSLYTLSTGINNNNNLIYLIIYN